MSWMPAKDPVLGDKQSCDAFDLIIVPRVRDLGDGFSVRRALPHSRRQMVGPFIFFDQIGPVQFVAGRGLDVRPHPHIGLATVTYLFDGRVMHRDSEGNALEITPGKLPVRYRALGVERGQAALLELIGLKIAGFTLLSGGNSFVARKAPCLMATRTCSACPRSASSAAKVGSRC
jgi:hypothetical protein